MTVIGLEDVQKTWPKDGLPEGVTDEEIYKALEAPTLKITVRDENTHSSSAPRVTGYSLVALGDLMAQPDTPVDYILDGRLVAGSVSGVVAKPKVGKSTLARNLALAVSKGTPFLGSETKQGEVIYLAMEERGEDIKADFSAMGAVGDEPIRIHAEQAPEAAMAELVDLVRRTQPRLLVIDPLFRLARIRDEKAYAETYNALGPLIDAARSSGTHILFTHHAGKGEKSDAIDAPLGSTALAGIVSTLIFLKRTEGYRTLQTVQRVGNDLPETVLEFDQETRTLHLGGSRKEAEASNAEERILSYLEEAAMPQTQEQIREGVEGHTGTIRAALTALVTAEKVKRTGSGKRGNPFYYEYWFSGFTHIDKTRKPETQNDPETRINTGSILVPEKAQKAILVPGTPENLFEVEI